MFHCRAQLASCFLRPTLVRIRRWAGSSSSSPGPRLGLGHPPPPLDPWVSSGTRVPFCHPAPRLFRNKVNPTAGPESCFQGRGQFWPVQGLRLRGPPLPGVRGCPSSPYDHCRQAPWEGLPLIAFEQQKAEHLKCWGSNWQVSLLNPTGETKAGWEVSANHAGSVWFTVCPQSSIPSYRFPSFGPDLLSLNWVSGTTCS